jgi:hypothetical protein
MLSGRDLWWTLTIGLLVGSAGGCGSNADDDEHLLDNGGDHSGPPYWCRDDEGGRTSCFCYPPELLTLSTYPGRPPHEFYATVPPNAMQHIEVDGCEAFQYFWIDEPRNYYWAEVVTNCRAFETRDPAGHDASCYQPVGGGGGENFYPREVSYAISCTCCVNGECGLYCQPIEFVSCADYNYRISSRLGGDPEDHPESCDCTHDP